MEFTEDEVQQKIDAILPIEKKKYFLTVVVSDPEINLNEETDKIEIKTQMEVHAPGGLRGQGSSHVIGSLHYDANEAALYLIDPILVDLNIKKLPEKFKPQAKSLAQNALSKSLAKRPIFRLKDDNLKHQMVRAC